MMSDPNALAVYGTLAPGEDNHWVVRNLKGDWLDGTVVGYIFEISWGPATGYPGFLPATDGTQVPVKVLVSDDLAKNWRTIDDFEGDGYERRVLPVTLVDWTYIALTENDD